jgi:hypothetical protein
MCIKLDKFARRAILWSVSLCLLAFCGEGAFAQTSTLVGQDAGHTEGGAGANCGDTGVGYLTLYTSPCNDGQGFNTAIGIEALYLNTAQANTAVGAYALVQNASGYFNTATGFRALSSNQNGALNSAFGYEALQSSTSSSGNAAFGALALQDNTSGSFNTGFGYGSLTDNTTGSGNTAVGGATLAFNGNGYWNTAVGEWALYHNVGPVDACSDPPCSDNTGTRNTGVGYAALTNNVGGYRNTALGSQALQANGTGNDNVAIGVESMLLNAIGSSNVALGTSSLANNFDGSGNFALGTNALGANVHGCNQVAVGVNSLKQFAGSCGNEALPGNIAIGFSAGAIVAHGTNNIDIGSSGVASDNGVTRIGFDGIGYSHTTGYVGTNKAFISGIYSSAIAGPTATVYVNEAGQLGTSMQSSERFKSDIVTMSDMAASIGRLRPVTFHYKTDPTRTLQYGLIAEEVAEVFPELVMHDRDGNIASVHYEELAPILLSALQEQQRTAQTLDGKIRSLEDKNAALTAQIADLNQIVALEKRQQDQVAAQANELRELKQEIAALSLHRPSEKSLVASR